MPVTSEFSIPRQGLPCRGRHNPCPKAWTRLTTYRMNAGMFRNIIFEDFDFCAKQNTIASQAAILKEAIARHVTAQPQNLT
ncbi:hypothetical protein [Methylobacterium sp. Leaf117]|uniref:hypothetical protein n=1 Tax=Methylobacterium sp. Leaf117 TaxID=1736260 RepID=UPI0012E1A264|nr:hypothetical protein [Methylobacterium sp. Leaf117]